MKGCFLQTVNVSCLYKMTFTGVCVLFGRMCWDQGSNNTFSCLNRGKLVNQKDFDLPNMDPLFQKIRDRHDPSFWTRTFQPKMADGMEYEDCKGDTHVKLLEPL